MQRLPNVSVIEPGHGKFSRKEKARDEPLDVSSSLEPFVCSELLTRQKGQLHQMMRIKNEWPLHVSYWNVWSSCNCVRACVLHWNYLLQECLNIEVGI